MIFKSIYLKEGFYERKINFSKKVNLIHSNENSKGKTTLLRLMLYALGYSIPNTKKINFNKCEVEMLIETEKKSEIKLTRNDLFSIQVEIDSEKRTYVLPEQHNEIISLFFETTNKDILSNILGSFYVDQEKGWTLLNRGIVIGSIHFNIEELIRGLSGIDCTELIKKESQLSREIAKYKQMFSVAQYQETLQTMAGSIVTENYEDKVNSELDRLLISKREIKKELNRIDNVLTDNRRFKKFVAEMKLLVTIPDGTVIRVTEDNIFGLNDSISLLVAKRKVLSAKYSNLADKIETLQKEHDKELEQLSFFESASQIDIFDKRISRMPLNPFAIKQEIAKLEKQLKIVRENISRLTKTNNNIVSDISNKIIKYSSELGLGDKDSISKTYLFTSNLKELSGAILHKTAFAFRLAYILVLEKILKIKLPILLDSPTGKEVDQENIKLMMDILKRDFSDHQIIIASIFEYDFDVVNKIEIHNRLIEINTI